VTSGEAVAQTGGAAGDRQIERRVARQASSDICGGKPMAARPGGKTICGADSKTSDR